MKQRKTPLRGSVTQNTVSVRMREQDGIGFLARLGILFALVLLFLITAIVGWRAGWPHRLAVRVENDLISLTQKANFEIRDIIVEGRVHESKEALSDALGLKQGMPLFSVDLDETAEKLNKLSWIDEVRMERRWPDTIAVSLTERAPMARWQTNDKFYVIDNHGRILPSAKAENFSNLLQVVGAGAEKETRGLLALLRLYPEIREKVEAAVRVSERRWDLHLPGKVVVRLPETDVNNALHRLSVLMAEEKILERNIVAIDLRIPDRLVLEPAEGPKSGDKRP